MSPGCATSGTCPKGGPLFWLDIKGARIHDLGHSRPLLSRTPTHVGCCPGFLIHDGGPDLAIPQCQFLPKVIRGEQPYSSTQKCISQSIVLRHRPRAHSSPSSCCLLFLERGSQQGSSSDHIVCFCPVHWPTKVHKLEKQVLDWNV